MLAQSAVARQTFGLICNDKGTGGLTVFTKREKSPLLVLHQPGHQPDARPDDQHAQGGVQQEVDQVTTGSGGKKQHIILRYITISNHNNN